MGEYTRRSRLRSNCNCTIHARLQSDAEILNVAGRINRRKRWRSDRKANPKRAASILCFLILQEHEISHTVDTQVLPARMRAIVQTAYGGADTLELRRIALPCIADNEVLLRVHAAGVDRAVWHLLTGTPYLVRPILGLCKPRNAVPGFDLSGQIVAVGARVRHLCIGDEVFGSGTGAYAEFARARADQVVPRPRLLDPNAAAVCAMSGVSALQALIQAGRVRAGQRVLILGASGGVGAYAVQIARYHGAEVSALCSAAKADFVRHLGAQHVFDYARFDVRGHAMRYDLVLDIAGNRSLSVLRKLLTDHGALVVIGGEHAGPWTGGLGRHLAAWLLNPFARQRLVPLISVVREDDLTHLADLIVAGHVRPPLDDVFLLSEAGHAINHMALGHVRGKVAVRIAPHGPSPSRPQSKP